MGKVVPKLNAVAKARGARTKNEDNTPSKALTDAELAKYIKKAAAGLCKSCDQTTHDDEKMLLPRRRKLKWIKYWFTAKGEFKLSGDECYPCLAVRRRFFTESQE